MADTPKRSRELESNSLDIEEWTVEEVEQWLTKTGFKEEAPLFSGEQISGKALCQLDRETLKELGIQSIGKQLELLRNVKSLFDKKQNQQLHVVKETSKWKRKIRKEDQSTWSESNKNLYRVKIAVIRREAAKIWPGNQKIYFKQNPTNNLKLEELTEKLTGMCSVEEIGFGREAIRSHILQWSQEKNRRLSDGYDFDAEHTRAKRAKKSPRLDTSTESSTSEGGDTESVDSSELEETGQEQVEHDVDKMSNVSARVVLLVSFNVNSFDYLSVKGNLNPVAKYLKVKTRGMGKYEMAVPIAKELVRKGYVVPKDPTQKLNYNRIKRDEIKSEKDISLLFVKENTASSSVKQSILSVDAGLTSESKDLNESFCFAVSDELTDCS